ncbi:hypothetical protein JYT17_00105, partial [Nitrospira defluvii]|nr:hypothetical protein [Nitrospira defluvii]
GGFEPPTSCVSSKRSPPELRAFKGRISLRLFKYGFIVKKNGCFLWVIGAGFGTCIEDRGYALLQ